MEKLTSALIIALIAFSAPAATIYVDANGTGDYPTIQAAINDANDGDEIILIPGTYTGDGNRDIDFLGKAITVRSENGPNDCIIDCNGSENEPHRGFNFHNQEDKNSVLDGFTIKNGYMTDRGGGILCVESSPSISNCIITKNFAKESGAGMYNDYSNPKITDCIFSYNHIIVCVMSGGGGGGMTNSNSSPNITNCKFIGNSGFCGGGGMANWWSESRPIVTNCIFSCNTGSGMGNIVKSSPILTNCVFTNNLGGGMYGGNPILTNCFFSGNSTEYNGGAIAIWSVSDDILTLTNCIFSGNSAKVSGGAIYIADGNCTSVVNCTFTGNTAPNGNAVACDPYDQSIPNTLRMTNCILWDSTPEIWNKNNSTIIVSYSNIQGGWPGTGNIDMDPCFVDSGYWDPNGTPADTNDDFWVDGDYHLIPESPCINTGDPNYIPEPNETDLDGLPRVIGGRIDMGAYEFSNTAPVAIAGPNQIAYAFINGLADVTLDGSASYDDDNDVLDYYWSWFIDSNLFEANGISPTIQLPVGQHQIELIVDDGWTLSEPNYCTIEVIEPLRTWLWLWPPTLNCNSRPQNITTFVYLPKDIGPDDVNNEPLTMYPCEIQSKYQRVFRMGHGRYARTVVMAAFDKDEICDYFGAGWHKLEVTGRLHSGRYFCGSNIIRITRPNLHKWPLRRFHNRH